jgi:hypothetical protein
MDILDQLRANPYTLVYDFSSNGERFQVTTERDHRLSGRGVTLVLMTLYPATDQIVGAAHRVSASNESLRTLDGNNNVLGTFPDRQAALVAMLKNYFGHPSPKGETVQ